MSKELMQCEWVSTVKGDRCDNHGGHPRICTAVITDLNAELRRQSQELERAREALDRTCHCFKSRYQNVFEESHSGLCEYGLYLAALAQPAQKQGVGRG